MHIEVYTRTFLGLPDEQATYAKSKAVILPVPYEGTVSYGVGTSKAPEAIIEASSYLEPWEPRLSLDYFSLHVATLAPMSISTASPKQAVEEVKAAVGKLLDDGKWVAMVGGEHSITPGAVAAHKGVHEDFAVLQIDAHADLRQEYEGTEHSHACAMRRVRDLGIPVVAVGIRSITKEEHEEVKEKGWPIFWAWQLVGDWIDQVLAQLPQKVYLSFDVDGLCPSIMPGTGTPEPGGMTWEQTFNLIERLCTTKDVIGFDLVEVSPIAASNISEFTAAKLAAMVIGLSERKAGRAD